MLFGGTTEGRQLAQALDGLCAARGLTLTVFVATEYGQEVLPALTHGQVHTGRLAPEAMTDRLAGLLDMRGISCAAIHGDIPQAVREKTLQKFREGKMRVLVATAVAARGLDIDDVDAVFNYDVPDENEYYIHRIGRTGRAKRHGVAFSLVSSVTESIRLDDIKKATGSQIRAVHFNDHGDLVTAKA